jgi:PiT family inorganic phosphate transporter
MEWILIVAVIFLAFANGANDNFKGFATVWGSGTLEYRQALTLATIATIAGSLLSWMLADGLVQQFSGKGLVASEATQSLPFIASVAIGAAVTVFLATRLGLPVSTTHALIGGLVGAGAAQAGGVHFAKLADTFLLPLLVSPLLAA